MLNHIQRLYLFDTVRDLKFSTVKSSSVATQLPTTNHFGFLIVCHAYRHLPLSKHLGNSIVKSFTFVSYKFMTEA